jgi:hypothetical protein
MYDSFDVHEKREKQINERIEMCAENAKREATEKLLVICKDVALASAFILFFLKELINVCLFDGMNILHLLNCAEAVFWIFIYGFIVGAKSDY